MAGGRQIAHHGEAIVLRTWPFHEADLLISLFTRDAGRVKGVARHAMKSRKRFGGALEPATFVRAHYTERPRQDLVRLDSFEILWSPMTAAVDALRLAGLQLVVEVLEEALPDGAPDDNIFRLAMTCLTAMQTAGDAPPAESTVWLAATYFSVWANRLLGWWPELSHCAVCRLDLQNGDAWWSPVADGVTCADDRRPQSHLLAAAAIAQANTIARTPLESLREHPWPEPRTRELRRFALAVLERNLDRRLRSAVALVA